MNLTRAQRNERAAMFLGMARVFDMLGENMRADVCTETARRLYGRENVLDIIAWLAKRAENATTVEVCRGVMGTADELRGIIRCGFARPDSPTN